MSPFSSPIDTNAGQLASVPVTIQNRKSSDSFFEKRSRSVYQRARRNRCVPGGAACGEEPSASRESEVGLEVYRRGTRASRRAAAPIGRWNPSVRYALRGPKPVLHRRKA